MSILDKISSFLGIKNQEKESSDLIADSYIGKFVKQDYLEIGESIGVEGRRIIIKNPESVMSIPVEAVYKNEETISVGDFNRDEALQLGKAWAEQKDVMKFDEKGMLIK
ncbi:MAG: hypothetical protein OIN87_08735 [Candidatus Methanoperedens sp.]|nr:hypothetical protein [Candidatus Methanoperedens sp.]